MLAGPAGRIDPVHLHLPDPTTGLQYPDDEHELTGSKDTMPPIAYPTVPPLTQSGAWSAPMRISSSLGAPPPLASPGMTGQAPGFGVPALNPNTTDLRAQRESWEKAQILSALEKTSGNQKEAAKLLGVSRRTLINKIEAYGIARPRKR